MLDGWEGRYAELLDLRNQRGGQLLREPLPAEGGLRAWAARQQQLWRKGELAVERCASGAAPLLSWPVAASSLWRDSGVYA